MIAAGGQGPYTRLCTVIGREELVTDPAYATSRDRAKNADALCDEIQKWVERHTYDEVFEILEQAEVPAGGVFSVREIMTDPHYAAREDIVTVEHPRAGPVKMPAVLPKLGLTPGEIRWPGPELGEHNSAIYGGLLGITETEMADLAARSVI